MIETFLKVEYDASTNRSRKSIFGIYCGLKFSVVTSALRSVETNAEFILATSALFIFLRSTQCSN